MDTIMFALQWIAQIFMRSEPAVGAAHQDELLADVRHRVMSRYY
jgi:hypothetical protein